MVKKCLTLFCTIYASIEKCSKVVSTFVVYKLPYSQVKSKFEVETTKVVFFGSLPLKNFKSCIELLVKKRRFLFLQIVDKSSRSCRELLSLAATIGPKSRVAKFLVYKMCIMNQVLNQHVQDQLAMIN